MKTVFGGLKNFRVRQRKRGLNPRFYMEGNERIVFHIEDTHRRCGLGYVFAHGLSNSIAR